MNQAVVPQSLVRAALSDTLAFSELVETLHPAVYRWALTFARDPDEADEITQETFVRVHLKLDQFRGDSSIEGWVYLITRRVALQRRRTVRRRATLFDNYDSFGDSVYTTDPGARVDRQRISDFIKHFFLELPPRQREVFDLVDLQGHDPAEVAKMIGSRDGTVRANLFKARSAMRKRILDAHPSWKEIVR